jgi:hypothetical protein
MMNVSMMRSVAALGLAALASNVQAQESRVGPKWAAWVGCWTSSVPGAPAADGGVVCITPAAQGGDAVDVTTITDGKVASTQRIDASGVERPLEAKGCTGVQRAAWSADERRIYLRSSSTCDGLKSTASGILSMTATGEWLDVRGVSSYGTQSVRVARYREAGVPASLPAEVASALRERGAGVEAARVGAGAPIGASGVIEASRAADSSVVAAWLLEREQRFTVDAKMLVQLADAGVPGAVTDAVVAVSNPSAFRLARASQQSDVIVTDAPRSGRRVTAMAQPYDPWMWGSLGLDYGYRYGYPYGYRYGYAGSGYGYGYNNGYYGGYAPPIIIVTSGSQSAPGQMVKGRGYTGGSSEGATARERPSQDTYRSPPPSSASPSSSSSGSSGGSSSGSSGSTERTAKPRS